MRPKSGLNSAWLSSFAPKGCLFRGTGRFSKFTGRVFQTMSYLFRTWPDHFVLFRSAIIRGQKLRLSRWKNLRGQKPRNLDRFRVPKWVLLLGSYELIFGSKNSCERSLEREESNWLRSYHGFVCFRSNKNFKRFENGCFVFFRRSSPEQTGLPVSKAGLSDWLGTLTYLLPTPFSTLSALLLLCEHTDFLHVSSRFWSCLRSTCAMSKSSN